MVIDALPTPAVANNNYKSITPSPTVDTADNAVATKKKKGGLVFGNKIFDFLRVDTFDTVRFQRKKKVQVKGEDYQKAEYEIFYTEDEMEKFDAAHQKYLLYDFDKSIYNTRMKEEKKQLDKRGSRSAAAANDDDLTLTFDPTNGSSTETTDRTKLSRYILEDVLQCCVATRFLLLVAQVGGWALQECAK